ncbi:MAG: transglycosylase domain-containing protein [Lentihominibacter sp.]
MSKKYRSDEDFFAAFDKVDDIGSKDSDTGNSDEFFYGSGRNYRKNKQQTEANRFAGKNEVKQTRRGTSRKSQGSRSGKASAGASYYGKKSTVSSRSKSAATRQKKSGKSDQYIAMAEKGIARAQKYVGTGAANRISDEGFKGIIKLAVLACMVLVMGAGVYVAFTFLKAPIVNGDEIYDAVSQSSIMYDTDGNEIQSLYLDGGNRSIIKYKDIPQNMIDSIVAIEDQKFWTHNGFNFIRMIGAVKDSIFGGGQIRGTSTVTQQLARNVYLAEIKSQRSISRKITEMYCTIALEKELTKEEIMEAYLNTIYLGFNSYGIETAADSYFNKNAKDMTLTECAALAALPQSPDSYAIVYADYYNNRTDLPVIKKTYSVTYRYNGALSEDRRNLVLDNMFEMGYIDASERDKSKAAKLEKLISIGAMADASASSYFTDYALDTLIEDMTAEKGLTEADVRSLIYTGGLKIYTTMDSRMQNIMEEEFAKPENFSRVAYARKNADGDIVGEKGKLLAYAKSNILDGNDAFLLKKGEYRNNNDGSITIYKGKRLNLFSTEVNGAPDVSIEFKEMYTIEDGVFYLIESGALSIPQGYKESDAKGNCIVSAQFFTDYPDFFEKVDGGLQVSSANYSLKQKVRQPQGASVIIENGTGEVRAMMGGRGIEGKRLFNRAVHPRQPGSSIKPLAIYGPALQMSLEYEEDNKGLYLDTSEGSDWGKYMTAGSIINDAKTVDGNGKVWPRNVYRGYKGNMTMREAIQQSVNVCSYKTYLQIERNEGPQYSIELLKRMGITTLNEEIDANPAALALGGLSRGMTPLEEAAAFATFPNGGTYQSPIFYTKVCDRNGDVLMENSSKGSPVFDPGVAWIMTDILRTVVTSGGGRNAAIGTQPVGGKTGTTTDQYDIWFTGFTPQYTMSMWMGNDINMDLSDSSPKAARFWSTIMRRVCEGIPTGSFFARPANVQVVGGEYYTIGTYSKVSKKKSTESKTTEPTTEETLPSITDPPPTTTTPTVPSSSSTAPSSHTP